MHELSLLRGVVDTVAAAVTHRQVIRVNMLVGTRSGVDIYALRQAWELAIQDTCCESAILDLNIVEAKVWCPSCNDAITIDEYFALRCPICDTPTGQLVSGNEFKVQWVDVEEDPLAET